MKAFLAAAAFFVASLAATAFVYQGVGVNASEAFSAKSVRLDHRAVADGRLGWAASH